MPIAGIIAFPEEKIGTNMRNYYVNSRFMFYIFHFCSYPTGIGMDITSKFGYQPELTGKKLRTGFFKHSMILLYSNRLPICIIRYRKSAADIKNRDFGFRFLCQTRIYFECQVEYFPYAFDKQRNRASLRANMHMYSFKPIVFQVIINNLLPVFV